MARTGWPKRITVDKRIVSLLSRSTYEKFPKAIREAVSNAYDADATSVYIDIDVKGRQIVIEDNGVGMTPEEFDFYLRIAGQPRGKSESIKFGRKRIGRLGVGFLAVFPFCETLEITSTAQNSDTVLVAEIPSSRFVEETTLLEDVSDILVEGHERADPTQHTRHYTRLRLSGLTSLVDEYFEPKAAKHGPRSQYDIGSWSGINRLTWELQETLPLDFPGGSSRGASLGQQPVGMEVRLNGERLFRNDPGGEVLDDNGGLETAVGRIMFRYAITTNWEAIHPFSARGMKLRLRNVGVGERTYFDLGIRGRTWSRLHWIAGEIHIIEGLDEAIALDRDGFTWSPEYEDFRDFFRERLSQQAYRIEDIASAEKKIASLLQVGEPVPPGPTIEILERSIDALRSTGFKVIRETMASSCQEVPVRVNRAEKTVTIIEDHPALKDVLPLAHEVFNVRYARWNYRASEFPACRLTDDGKLEVNRDYPLFSNPSLGELFLKIHVLLLLAVRRSSSQAEMYQYLVNALMEEFGRS